MHASLATGRRSQPGQILVGAVERIGLPDWRIARLRAKVDTGARSSALHVEQISVDGDRVRFEVVLARDGTRRVPVETKIVRWANVRSSTGEGENRIIVKTRIRLGPVEKVVEVSLASRGPMLFRMLLGRSALGEEFLVDPSRRYLWERPSARRTSAPGKRRLRTKTGSVTKKRRKRSGGKP